MASRKKPTIIGSLPLPIGGVTIHVERLLYHLEKEKITFTYVDLKKDSLKTLIIAIIRHKHIHLHTSNAYLRFLISMFCFLSLKKLTYTLHGNLGRYNDGIKNFLDRCAIKLAYRPIMLNKSSFEKALKLNSNCKLSSPFLPPNIENDVLDSVLMTMINNLRKQTRILFCTNASALSRDKDGQEIYGIFELIEDFKKNNSFGLILSDPSGTYTKAIHEKQLSIPSNILIILSLIHI